MEAACCRPVAMRRMALAAFCDVPDLLHQIPDRSFMLDSKVNTHNVFFGGPSYIAHATQTHPAILICAYQILLVRKNKKAQMLTICAHVERRRFGPPHERYSPITRLYFSGWWRGRTATCARMRERRGAERVQGVQAINTRPIGRAIWVRRSVRTATTEYQSHVYGTQNHDIPVIHTNAETQHRTPHTEHSTTVRAQHTVRHSCIDHHSQQ